MLDGDLELKLGACVPGIIDKGYAPVYRFQMHRAGTPEIMGRIDLRVGHGERLERYAGHIGYRVEPPYRGRRLAARAVRLLLPLALRHGLRPVWITCNPENTASRRTIELAGGVYVETLDVPPTEEMYASGSRRKCRFRLMP